MASDQKNTGVITGPLAALKLAQIAAYDSTLNYAAKRVLVLLAGYANEDGICWPSIKKMAKNIGTSRQALIKQINILIDHGYLTRKERYQHGGRRGTNLYQLNYLLANTYKKTPEAFCKHNVTLVVTYLVTLGRYRAMQPSEVTSHVNSSGDTNITPLTKQTEHKKKEYNNAISQILKRNTVRANAWDEQKEREKATGITQEHMKKLAELSDQLRKYKNSNQMVEYDLKLKHIIKKMNLSPLRQVEYAIMQLELDVAKEAKLARKNSSITLK